MPFFRGMTCCKPGRVSLGMECSYRDMLGCAFNEIGMAFERSPIRAEKLLFDLLDVFPPQDLLPLVRRVRCDDAFIAASAKWCAALPDKAMRHLFLDGFKQDLTQAEHDRFVGLLGIEWKRLRNIP